MRNITFATTQFEVESDRYKNIEQAEQLIVDAAQKGANVVLMQELFASPYWCKDQDPKYFGLAESYIDSPMLKHFSILAKRLEVVLPISYFEVAGNNYFNSLAMIDADGRILDNYRKSHIPDGPGYQEKFYFTPGDTGFRVWQTRYGKFGAAICWDQWFPEAARIMALKGAEAIFYPTAIGSEPTNPKLDSKPHWQRVMQGHSGANMLPIVAANRIGTEVGDSCELSFYGGSFITDNYGEKVVELDAKNASLGLHEFDLDQIALERANWGLFRDRRPELYRSISEY